MLDAAEVAEDAPEGCPASKILNEKAQTRSSGLPRALFLACGRDLCFEIATLSYPNFTTNTPCHSSLCLSLHRMIC